VKETTVDHGVKTLTQDIQFQGVSNHKRGFQGLLLGLFTGDSDQGLVVVNAPNHMATRGQEQGVFTTATADIQNITDNHFLIGEGFNHGLGFANGPGTG
jgi:hypothetical protein